MNTKHTVMCVKHHVRPTLQTNHIQKISCLHFERECDDASMSISIFPLAKIYNTY